MISKQLLEELEFQTEVDNPDDPFGPILLSHVLKRLNNLSKNDHELLVPFVAEYLEVFTGNNYNIPKQDWEFFAHIGGEIYWNQYYQGILSKPVVFQ